MHDKGMQTRLRALAPSAKLGRGDRAHPEMRHRKLRRVGDAWLPPARELGTG